MTSTESAVIPEWDLVDRLAKSLRNADMSKQDMADYLEVHRNTITTWLHGRITPNPQTLRLWALRTGVPYEWLRGDQCHPHTRGGQVSDKKRKPPRSKPDYPPKSPVDGWGDVQHAA